MQEKSSIFAKNIFYMSVDELRDLIDGKTLSDIIQYCELNGKSPLDVVNKTLKDNLIIMKYGDKPPMFIEQPKTVPLEEKPIVLVKEITSIAEKEPVLVDTPLEIPDVLPVFQEETLPKRKKRPLNVK